MRITASNLEAFRLYQEFEWMKLEEIEAQIRGEKKEPTPAMLLGRAYDELVFENKHHDTIMFDLPSAEQSRIPGALYQVWLRGTYRDHQLIGRLDAIKGNVIYDLKAVTRPKKPEDYGDSLQWQFYCYLAGVTKFVYRIAQLYQDKSTGVWITGRIDDVELYFDQGSEKKLMTYLNKFIAFCQMRGIEPGEAYK